MNGCFRCNRQVQIQLPLPLPLPLTAPLVAVATDCLDLFRSPDDHKSLCYGPKTKTCDDFLTLLQLLRMRNTFKVAVVVVEVKSEPV